MSAPAVQVETRGAVALVILNRPESGNALNLQVAMDLLAAAMTCARNAAVRAVVLSGAGRHFCFGGDLRAFGARAPGGADYIRELTTYLPAEEALSWGLVNEVVADEQLLARALEVAEKLASGASAAFGATKRLIAHSLGAFESQMVLESETIARHAVGEEGREGVSAFLDKRTPDFPHRD